MITVQTQQILVPKQVYIGDKAEIRCSFTSDSALLKALAEKGSGVQLSFENFCQELDFTQYDIKDVQIQPSGINYYTLVISLVPWRTGEIQLPEYKLSRKDISDEELYFKFEPISIVSLTEKDSITVLRDITPPLLLPGTIYKLYGGLVALLLFLIVAIRLIVKHKSVALFIKNRIFQLKFNKNKRATIKALNRLGNEEISDHDCSERIQKIMRAYLEVRYSYPFNKVVTSELKLAFGKATNYFLSEEKLNASDEIVSIFIRTDFVRYSANAKFMEKEKAQIIQRLIDNIEILESSDLKEEEGEDA